MEKHIAIVPAESGYRTVYADGEGAEACAIAGEPIIAWRIETEAVNKTGGKLFSSVWPITVDGDAASNAMGVQYPDGRVSAHDMEFASLNDYTAHLARQTSRRVE